MRCRDAGVFACRDTLRRHSGGREACDAETQAFLHVATHGGDDDIAVGAETSIAGLDSPVPDAPDDAPDSEAPLGDAVDAPDGGGVPAPDLQGVFDGMSRLRPRSGKGYFPGALRRSGAKVQYMNAVRVANEEHQKKKSTGEVQISG